MNVELRVACAEYLLAGCFSRMMWLFERACRRGDVETVKQSFPVSDHLVLLGMREALESGHENVADLLLSTYSVDTAHVNVILVWAASLETPAVMRYFIRRRGEGLDLTPALKAAVDCKRRETVKFLLESGAKGGSDISTRSVRQDIRMLLFEYGSPVDERVTHATTLTNDAFSRLWHLKKQRVRPAIDFSLVEPRLRKFLKQRRCAQREMLLCTTMAEDCVRLVFKYV